MDIKSYIKKMGYTQSDIAEEIGVSRPTLDLYIGLFEKGKHIPKVQYEQAFQRLFRTEDTSPNNFKLRLNMEKRFLRKENTKYNDTSENESIAGFFSKLHDAIISDVKKGYDKDIYVFILLLIKKYHNDDALKYFSKYYVNLYCNDGELEKSMLERIYYSNFHGLISNINSGNLKFDEKEYDIFVQDRRRMYKERELQKRKTAEKIHELLEQSMNEFDYKIDDPSEEQVIKKMLELYKS